MSILEKQTRWPKDYEVDRLPGLTAGEPVVEFVATPSRVRHEGLVIRVTGGSKSWLGNFQRGDGLLDLITATPSRGHMCVVAGGHGYWVPVQSPHAFERIRVYPVQEVLAIEAAALLVLADFTAFAAYAAEGMKWLSREVSWDGLRILKADATTISGLAWDAPLNQEVEFVIDSTTGHVLAGPEPPQPPPSLKVT